MEVGAARSNVKCANANVERRQQVSHGWARLSARLSRGSVEMQTTLNSAIILATRRQMMYRLPHVASKVAYFCISISVHIIYLCLIRETNHLSHSVSLVMHKLLANKTTAALVILLRDSSVDEFYFTCACQETLGR